MSTEDDRSTTYGAWCDLVRRARLGPRLKASAMIVGSYANADGTGVYCGVARLALDGEIGYSTARRHLARLRQMGLIERTARNRQPGKADEYRLALPPDLLSHVKVPTPGEYREMVGQVREAAARTAQGVSRRADPEPESRTAQDVSRTKPRTAHLGASYRSRREPPPPIPTPHRKKDRPSAEVQVEGSPNTRTRRGTDIERQRQAAALAAWSITQERAS